ncbi:FAD:protein FMN transferase [Halanaerobium sp. Z-7514]|uniref:FAD:protein FMN transferase n=1 Tax=Halanaerobium polyolivorans TaxID=2886943 RepID=A0AAW4WSG4_9FIRM|nr:FAD:protein FMN transferase [Halanaerobium polyolivorans]
MIDLLKAKKLIFLLVIVISSFLIITGCGRDSGADIQSAEDNSFIMNTLVQMRAHGENAEIAVEESMDRIREIEYLMSRTLEASEVSQINDNPGEFIEISEETQKVIAESLYFAELSSGKFDPSIGPIVDLWGIGTEEARVPSQAEIEEVLEFVDYNNLEIEDNRARVTKEGVKIDLGGIAKGYAADEVREIVKKHDVPSAFINIGGNVLVVGNNVDGSKWRIGIQDPRRGRGNVMAIVESKDQTIVTSGDYERYFEEDGEHYHHIFDPESGYPARTGLLSVTIITDLSLDADALSTIAYVKGLEAGMKFVEDIADVDAMFITEELDVHLSSGLTGIVEITGPDFNLIEGENFAD